MIRARLWCIDAKTMAAALQRRFLLGGAACAAPALFSPAARSQTILPEKELRILIGFQANGGTDIIARPIATQLQRRRLSRRVTSWQPGETAADAADRRMEPLVRAVLGDANLGSELVQPGLDVGTSTPQEGAARVAGHRKEWKARLESVGMRPIN